MKRIAFLGLAAAMTLSACATPSATLPTYAPVVDPGAPNAHRYPADLKQCQLLAQQAEQKYIEEQNAELGANIVGGILVGALLGAAVGNSDTAGWGAGYGAASGIAATDFETAHGGPRRIIDRCLAGRGHQPLSDLGRG